METLDNYITEKKRKFLSKREGLVYKMILNGKLNKEIAEEVGINEKTVSTYKARIAKKLGIVSISRINMLLAGYKLGIITINDIINLADAVEFKPHVSSVIQIN